MIIAAVAILGGVGLVFAVMIALANRKLKVFVDPRIDVVTGMLPGANCGACGMPGCRAFAEKLVKAESKPAGCNVASEDERSSIAGYLGVDAGNAVKTVARLMCAGGAYVSDRQADYRGHATCAAASAGDVPFPPCASAIVSAPCRGSRTLSTPGSRENVSTSDARSAGVNAADGLSR